MRKKIRTNRIILLGFALILVIMATLTAIWLTHTTTTNNNITKIVNAQEKTELVFAMRDAANQRALSLYRMSVLSDPFEQDEEYLRFRTLAEDFIKARLALAELGESKIERAAWLKAKPKIQQGTRNQNLVTDAIADGDISSANELMANTVIPTQNEVLNHLTRMLNLQKTHVANELNNVAEVNKRVYLQVTLLGSFALILGTIIAFLVVKTSTRSQEKLILAQQESQEANEHKSLFLANMSHELRTPLNAIIGYSEMLQEEVADMGVQSFVSDLDKINHSGKHLLNLINDILDVSKIEAGKMELYPEEFRLTSLIDEVSNTMKPLLTQNRNHFRVEPDDFDELMYTDLTKLRQTLFNLLSNACKFTEFGEVHLSFSKYTVKKEPWIKIAITDTGIGMDRNQMDKLFAPFTQADASTTRNYGGTGLGLTISKKFVEMMGGNISVTSESGKGSTFTINIPARLAAREDDAAA
jgi:signal transduction histidine kinase